MSKEADNTPRKVAGGAEDGTKEAARARSGDSAPVDQGEERAEEVWTSAPELDTVPSAKPVLDTVPMARAAPEDEDSLELNTEQRQVEADLLDHVFDLEASLATVQDAPGKVDLLLEIGSFWQQELRDDESAMAAYERVLELEPENFTAFDALEQLYRQAGQHAKLVSLLIAAAEQTDSATDRTHYLQQLAGLYQDIGEPDKAAMVLEAALEASPDRSTLIVRLQQLEAASPQTAAPEPSTDGLDDDHYEDLRGDPFEHLLRQLAQPLDDVERLEICHQLSKLALTDREDADAAIDYLRQALRINPSADSVYDDLQQIHEDLRSIDDLATLLREEAEASPPEARALLYKRLASLNEEQLDDRAAALLAYQQASRAVPDDEALLEKQVELGTQLQDWATTLEALTALTQLPHTETDQAQLLHRIGGVHQHQLGQRDEAQSCYVEALEVYPAHAPTIARLSEIYQQDERWKDLVEVLERAERYSTGTQQRSDLLVKAARVSAEQLGDEAHAGELLCAARKLDPERDDAVVLLAEVLWRQSRYEQAAPLLERMIEVSAPDAEAPDSHVLHQRLATIKDKLGDLTAALDHAREAYNSDPEGLPTLELLADLAHRAEQWEESHRANLQLIEREDQIGPELRTTAHRRLAQAAQQVSDQHTALASLRWLVDSDPSDTDSLSALSDLYQRMEDWPAVAKSKQALIAQSCGAVRIGLCLELAEVQWKRLGQPDLAAQSYQLILEEQPDHRSALHRMLDLVSELEHWPTAIEICVRLATLEEDPKLKAKYHYTAALIARDKLSDVDMALSMFNKTLDADPQDVRAFRDIDALCTERRDWKALERNYAKMLKRLPDKGFKRLKARLWQNLAEVLRTHRRDLEGAAAALEAAIAHDSEDTELLIVLAELYSDLGPKYLDKTIETHLALIRRDPTLIEAFRVLRRAFMAQKRYDPAWCLSGLLAFLEQASREELAFHRQYRVRTLLRVKTQLTDQMWAQLRHPAQDHDLTTLFALVTPAIALATARAHSEFGFKRKDRADLQDESDRLIETFRYVTAALSVVPSDLHVQPYEPVALSFAHTAGRRPSWPAHMCSSSTRDVPWLLQWPGN